MVGASPESDGAPMNDLETRLRVLLDDETSRPDWTDLHLDADEAVLYRIGYGRAIRDAIDLVRESVSS